MTAGKTVAAINTRLQELQIDRLVRVHGLLCKLAASTTGEAQKLVRDALAELESYGQTLNRETRGTP